MNVKKSPECNWTPIGLKFHCTHIVYSPIIGFPRILYLYHFKNFVKSKASFSFNTTNFVRSKDEKPTTNETFLISTRKDLSNFKGSKISKYPKLWCIRNFEIFQIFLSPFDFTIYHSTFSFPSYQALATEIHRLSLTQPEPAGIVWENLRKYARSGVRLEEIVEKSRWKSRASRTPWADPLAKVRSGSVWWLVQLSDTSG